MKRSSGNGKWWLLFLVVCGIALWWRLHDRGSSNDTPAPETPKPPEPPHADAMIVEQPTPEQKPEPPEPAVYTSDYNLHALSTDGKRALLVERHDPPRGLRVVAIDTGKVEADVAFTAYGASETEPPAFADEVVRARALLHGFPLGAGGRIATTPDGTAGAAEYGDYILPMHGDKFGPRLNVPAAYGPLLLDGKTMLVRAYHGKDSEDEGLYALAWATLDSPAVHEIDGTVDAEGVWALSDKGDALRILVRQAPGFTDCVVEVTLGKPFHVTRKRCLDNTKDLEVQLSPHGTWVAWQTRVDDDAPTRLRTMNIETGEIGIDLSEAGSDDLAIVTRGFIVLTDGGRVFAQDISGASRVVDPVSKVISPVALPHQGIDSCLPRGDHELVCEDHGSVSVVKI